MFLTSINEINRLRKEINRSLSKGMSKICLKVTIGKNWRSQNSIFQVKKICHQVYFWGALTHVDIIEF